MSPKNGCRKITLKDFKLDTHWKREKRETRNKVEEGVLSNGRMWSTRWRLGSKNNWRLGVEKSCHTS
jgi:hypothetical protein